MSAFKFDKELTRTYLKEFSDHVSALEVLAGQFEADPGVLPTMRTEARSTRLALYKLRVELLFGRFEVRYVNVRPVNTDADEFDLSISLVDDATRTILRLLPVLDRASPPFGPLILAVQMLSHARSRLGKPVLELINKKRTASQQHF